jgi:hypothetical protein
MIAADEAPAQVEAVEPAEPAAARFSPLYVAALAAGALAVYLLHVWSLLRFPLPYVDEAWLVSRAWGYVETGRQFGDLDVGIFDRFEGTWRCLALLPTWLQSLGLRFSATPELFDVRMVSLAFGMLLLAAVYTIGVRLGGRALGVTAALFAALSAPFFYSAHLARTDVIAAAFGFGAIALYLVAESGKRLWLYPLAGFVLAAAFEIHPNSIIYGLPIALLFAHAYGVVLFARREFWSFCAGGFAGVLVYLALHVLPNPETYFAFGRLAYGPTHTPPILTLDAAVILDAFAAFGNAAQSAYPFSWWLVIAGFAALFVRRSERSIKLAIVVVGVVLGFVLFVRSKQPFHYILFGPALDLAAAAAVAAAFEVGAPRSRARVYTSLAAVIVSAGLLALGVPDLSVDQHALYLEAENRIEEVVRPGESVMGRQQYWFGLTDHTFYSWEGLVYKRLASPGASIEEAFAEHKPDVFVVDQGNGKFFSDGPGVTLVLEHLRLPGAEMRDFLKRRGELLTTFDGVYGRTYVFRLHWDDDGARGL